MKTGTFLCWFFGHCFLGKDERYIKEVKETCLIQMKFCRRCGIDKSTPLSKSEQSEQSQIRG